MSTPSSRPVQLTDAQRQVLSAAAGRADGALILPARLKGNAARALAKSLLDKGLAREVRAKSDLPAWRQDPETGRAFALLVTKAGRAAVPEVIAATVEQPSSPKATDPTPALAPAPAPARDAAFAPMASAPTIVPGEAQPPSPDVPRPGSKLAGVIALLGRQQGTSVAEVMAATGWLPHTTRAVLSGLRKRGYALTREAGASGPLYRIGAPSAAAA